MTSFVCWCHFCSIVDIGYQKPGRTGAARETVRFIYLYVALFMGLASQALDGEAGTMKPVPWPICVVQQELVGTALVENGVF